MKQVITDQREYEAMMDILGEDAFNSKFIASTELTTQMIADKAITEMYFGSGLN